jgi:hypothetical protein
MNAIEEKIINSFQDNEPIDWSNPDFTGASANYYVNKYTNRPEDAGSIEGVHNVLDGIGYINPLADVANASMYLLEGNYAKASLSLLAAAPIIGDLAGSNKIISKSLLKGSSASARKNKELVVLGDNSRYINTEIITVPSASKTTKYQVSHTERFVDLIPDVSNARPAVIVKIKNLDSGNTIFQPFYRSTGRGHSAKSAGNWLPFEGILGKGTDVVINYGKNSSKKIKPGMVNEGWLVKGFKNKDGAIITSSLFEGKIKRGLPTHEKIDFYLRNKLNFNIVPK